MNQKRFSSVWDAIEDTPTQAENMRLRSRLMMALKDHIEAQRLTQTSAAALFGVTQPRISDLMRGKIDLFTIDTLVNMLSTANMHVGINIPFENPEFLSRRILLYSSHLMSVANSFERTKGKFKNLKKFRVFRQHVKAGPFTRTTLWDFWPVDFGLYMLVNREENSLPEGYVEESWKYSKVDSFFRLLYQIEEKDPSLFLYYVQEIVGKLSGQEGTLSSILAELFLQLSVSSSPYLVATRPQKTSKKSGDLLLEGKNFSAILEIKNIENRDGYSLDDHLYAARGIDASLGLISDRLKDGNSLLIKIKDPSKVFINDKGLSFKSELTSILTSSNKPDNAFEIIHELDYEKTIEDLIVSYRNKTSVETSENFSYKIVRASPQAKNGVIFAVPHRGKEFIDKVADKVSEAIKDQTGDGEAVVCVIYDFASIQMLRDEASLAHWTDRLEIMHFCVAASLYEKSKSYRDRCNNLIGIALVPSSPYLINPPSIQCFEHLVRGRDVHVKANLDHGYRKLTEIQGDNEILEYYKDLVERNRRHP